MKNKIHAIFLIIAFVFLTNRMAFAQAKIKFDTLEYTLKSVKIGEKVELKIPFTNVGNEPLVITRAQGTGIPIISRSINPISPNEIGFIEFQFPSNYAVTTKQYIYISTNSSEVPIVITVKVQIIDDKKQERVVRGVVSDKSGLIPFANVYVEGTNRGTQTDFDGKYSIKATSDEYLKFQCIGMKDTIIKASDTVINVILGEGVKLVEEYGPPYTPKTKTLDPTQVITLKDLKNGNNPRYNFKKNAKNNVFIIFVSELSSYDFSKEDLEFQQKYKLKYSMVGSYNHDYLTKYNNLTFKYLKRKYKKTWQHEIRKDAVGLELFLK